MSIKYLSGKELQDAKDCAEDCSCEPMGGSDNAVGICIECDCIVDEDGDACVGCNYSPITCDVCGYRVCDGSCQVLIQHLRKHGTSYTHVAHKHGVLIHTIKVCWYATKYNRKYFMAGLLHDVGKPLVAYQKDEDIETGEYSFTDHEERSYQVIKNWPFISEWTKLIVRHHYLIRSMSKEKARNPELYLEKKKVWDSLSSEMQKELVEFLKFDDAGKTSGWK